MRCLRRNRQAFWYAQYQGRAPVLRMDEWGNVLETGEQCATYGPPAMAWANISAALGEAAVQPFGTALDYSRVLCMEHCPFDEHALLWLNAVPGAEAEAVPHDHVVVKIASSLNGVLVAVKEVTAS